MTECPDPKCRGQMQGTTLCGVWVPDDPPFEKNMVMYHTHKCKFMLGRTKCKPS